MSALLLVTTAIAVVVALVAGFSAHSRSLTLLHSSRAPSTAPQPAAAGSQFKPINEASKAKMKQILSGDKKELRVLLLTAHPDDETMFFGPTLLALGQKYSSDDYHIQLYIHCLSKGLNCGNVRLEEMKKAAPLFQVSEERLLVDDLEDGQDWSVEDVAQRLARTVQRWKIDILLTFDHGGVSGHKNHIQCFRGAEHLSKVCRTFEDQGEDWKEAFEEQNESEPEDESGLLHKKNSTSKPANSTASMRRGLANILGDEFSGCKHRSSSFPPVYALRTTPIYVKYASHLTFPLVLSEALQNPNFRPLVFANPSPATLHQGMLAHASQYVWFRRLYIFFSQYVYYNVLDVVEA